MKLKLDAAVVAAAYCPPEKRRVDLYCSVNRGLVLEVRPNGKTYYARYSDQYGKQRQAKLGTPDIITFDQARKAARKLLAEAALGGDPVATKKERRAVPTYGELADQHVAHAKTYMKSFSTLEGYMKRIRKRWARVRLTDIKQQDVAAWLAELRAEGLAPATVEKTRTIMGKSFQLGAQWGIAGTDKNPLKGVPRPRFSNAREKYLNADEVARLLDAARTSRNKELGAIVRLLLLLGMRVSELLSLRWEHVDTAKRTLLIVTSKTGRSRRLPLPQAAVEIIDALPRTKTAIFLFPGRNDPTTHLTTIKHGWQAIRKAAGLGDCRIHDLRHSAASAWINNGVGIATVSKLLGHSAVASTLRYAHWADDTLMAAVEAGADKLKLA